MAHTVKLPPRVDLAAATELHESWRTALEGAKEILIDCAGVEMLGAAGAQLLVSLAGMVRLSDVALQLLHVSPTMQRDLHTLGLQAFAEEFTHHA